MVNVDGLRIDVLEGLAALDTLVDGLVAGDDETPKDLVQRDAPEAQADDLFAQLQQTAVKTKHIHSVDCIKIQTHHPQ